MNLPEALHLKNKKLSVYCKMRVEGYQLLYKAIDEDTDKYQNEIEDYNLKIETIIKESGGGQ